MKKIPRGIRIFQRHGNEVLRLSCYSDRAWGHLFSAFFLTVFSVLGLSNNAVGWGIAVLCGLTLVAWGMLFFGLFRRYELRFRGDCLEVFGGAFFLGRRRRFAWADIRGLRLQELYLKGRQQPGNGTPYFELWLLLQNGRNRCCACYRPEQIHFIAEVLGRRTELPAESWNGIVDSAPPCGVRVIDSAEGRILKCRIYYRGMWLVQVVAAGWWASVIYLSIAWHLGMIDPKAPWLLFPGYVLGLGLLAGVLIPAFYRGTVRVKDGWVELFHGMWCFGFRQRIPVRDVLKVRLEYVKKWTFPRPFYTVFLKTRSGDCKVWSVWEEEENADYAADFLKKELGLTDRP